MGAVWGVVALLSAVLPVAAPCPLRAETWLLQSGEEYFGDLESYNFRSKEVVLRKADGKPFAFPAREMAFGAKLRLIFSRPFLQALLSHRPPVLPVLGFVAALLLGILAPLYASVMGSAHVLGVEATFREHFQAFLKLTGLCAIMGVVWLTVSAVMDPGVPVLPDTSADLVLGLTSLNCGIIFCSLLISLHYRRSFWKGMALSLLTGVFSLILWTAECLILLFLVTRQDLEWVVTRFVFDPLQWF